MEDAIRYRCRQCGNDTRFRAKASAGIDVTVNGRGEIIKIDMESQLVEDDNPPKVSEVTDCLVCGGMDIAQERDDSD